MARLPSTSTKQEQRELHAAKMAGKVYNREHLKQQRSELRYRADVRRLFGFGSIAGVNRHTRRPHENAREIMRRTMTPFERRAFAEAVRQNLALAA
jgi:hypothetical protein